MSDDLLKQLMEEFPEGQVQFTDEDTKGGGNFISENGRYSGFVAEVNINKAERKKATKTKAEGSIFYWMNITLAVKQRTDNGEVFTGKIYPKIRFEEGFMREYEQFCLASKCKAFNVDGKRLYFPQAAFEKGGAVGMPITFDVHMKTEPRKKKDETTGQWYEVKDINGNTEMRQVAEVVAWYPWDVPDRYIPEETKAPDASEILEDDDLPF